VRQREELEAALARANQEIAQLKEANSQSTDPQDSTTTAADLQVEMAETTSIVAPKFIDMNTTVAGLGLGTEGQQLVEPQEEYVKVKIDRDNGAREFQVLLDRSKVAAFSPSSVIQSPYDEECAPSYFLCHILQVDWPLLLQIYNT
jgi:hypothetical protein